ncbi:CRTAC1 family protein [Algoriphagus boritolerans]|uniref:CRTAC1 family protein n=1 Tax=Algoriphagus boritolerans TaxID=308111 RepID=UPI002FCE053B
MGLHHQLMRNMLQLNNGNGTFSEVGQAAGISTTDWSWTPLFADFDNDGYTDLFVSNGFLKDFTNLDFINYRQQVLQESRPNQQQVMELINSMPATKIGNYAFRNLNGLNFRNSSAEWGLDTPGNSNGAVYADLDQDGDLDLIINNLNEPAQIYQNLASDRNIGNYLQVKLIGSSSNSDGIGAKIRIYQGTTVQYQQQQIYKGFQGNVTSILHFGLESPSIDSIRINWPSGESQTVISPTANQQIELKLVDAVVKSALKSEPKGRFQFSSEVIFDAPTESFNDFKRQSQLLYSLSQPGPILASGDLDGDGLPELISSSFEDFLLVFDGENPSKTAAKRIPVQGIGISSILILDADGDGDLDIFLGKGGYEDLSKSDSRLQDQMLLNDGKGEFKPAPGGFSPRNLTSTSVSIAWDFDGDGQKEIFIGGGYIPGRWLNQMALIF